MSSIVINGFTGVLIYMINVKYRERLNDIAEAIKVLSNKFMDINKDKDNKEEDELIVDLKKALNEWRFKEIYFENVSDSDLVDFAIYEMEASKLKYLYLLKRVRSSGISLK